MISETQLLLLNCCHIVILRPLSDAHQHVLQLDLVILSTNMQLDNKSDFWGLYLLNYSLLMLENVLIDVDVVRRKMN